MLEELRNEALPFFLTRLRDLVQFEAYDHMDILRASHLFIILFRLVRIFPWLCDSFFICFFFVH